MRLFHLPLHAAADALFHLKHADLAFHMGEDLFKPRGDGRQFKQFLLFRNLQPQMGSDGIGQL